MVLGDLPDNCKENIESITNYGLDNRDVFDVSMLVIALTRDEWSDIGEEDKTIFKNTYMKVKKYENHKKYFDLMVSASLDFLREPKENFSRLKRNVDILDKL